MATIAIMAAISVGTSVASYFLQPKPKRQRVDRGRADDIRLQTSEEGVFLPKFKGWGRAAPNIIWHTDIVERVEEQSAGGGGKGGGGQATEGENVFTYTTTLCCAIAAGPVMNGLRRIWSNGEVILNLSGDNGGYYEGEDSSNTKTGTTSVNSYDAASGKRELTLAPGATVQFNSVLSHGAKTRPLTIYYRTGAVTSYEVYVNGVLVSTNSFPNTGDDTYQTRTISVALNDGLNTIKIKNTSGTFNLGIDRVFVFPGFADADEVTGIVSEEDFATVAPDLDEPAPYFNIEPTIDPGDGPGGFGGGSGSGTMTGLGGAQFAFYLGTEDQPQDATMVAEDGDTEVPAYRGVFYVVIRDLVMTSPQLPNLTFEFDEGTHDLAQAITDYYKEAGAKDSELDMSELEGIHFIGHVVDKMQPLEETLAPLEQWYNFDLLPLDGKIKAVLRGGAIVATIPEAKLAAYEEGGEPPAGALRIDYIDPSALPREMNVSYLEVAKDYHNATEVAARAVGLNQSPEEMTFPLVAESDEAVQVGLRELYRKYIERAVEFETGPEFHNLAPTNPVTLALSNISHRVRITQKQAQPGGGLIRWKGVTENVGVYSQVHAPGASGFEPRVVDYPGNSVLVIIDAPLVRAEDAGDGTAPVTTLAMCKRGTTRPWRGGVAFQEETEDDYKRVTTFQANSKIGVVRSTLGNFSDVTMLDRSNSFTVDFFNEVEFESFDEDVLSEQLGTNLFWVGVNGGQGEYLQAATATEVAPGAGYACAFTFTLLRRGRFFTEYTVGAHTTGEYLVVMDSTVKPRRADLKELNKERLWFGASVGQGINEAIEATGLDFTLRGRSLQPPALVNTRATRDGASNILVATDVRERLTGGLRSFQPGAGATEDDLVLKLQILNAGSTILPNGKERILTFGPRMPTAALLVSAKDGNAGVTQNSFTAPSSSLLAARTVQEVPGPDNYMEGAIRYNFLGERIGFGLQLTNRDWKGFGLDLNDANLSLLNPTLTGTLAMPYLVIVESITFGGSSANRLHVYEYGTRIFSASSLPGQSDYDEDFGWLSSPSGVDIFRIRFNFVGSTVNIEKAHAANAPLKRIATGKRAAEFPMFGVVGGPGDGIVGAGSIFLSTYPHARTIYSAAQQTNDFGSTQASVQADIWRESRLVGAGVKTRVTL